ncbi:MAG TPA: hydrogenase maturation nickel metallochaperone HypA [Sedimentisphaerales bacterium]|nr:hydrogenase maturation nickel metallochaperone HypA [Sedimentisphaerales bacterium]
MHEAMVAQSLLKAISAEAKKHDGRPVAAKISCGKLYAINDEALCFAFEALAKGTTCEGMKLEIEHKPIQGRCKNCGQEFDVEACLLKCPECGSDDFELPRDAPLLLEEIEFQTE